MLTRHKPMSRGAQGFKRTGLTYRMPERSAAPDREQRLAERAARAMAMACPSPVNVTMARGPAPAAPIEKENPLRSEPYRRLVAALPCEWCGIVGYSQHAHENEGKGKALKVDDRRAMPLCAARPGAEGCHTAFDQYRLVPGGREAHVALGRAMAARTRKQIMEAGRWPVKLPLWQEGGSDAT
ncbi:hypothetical protein [Alicycliphilus denitrificans]|uniref:hypothetical protein n=1 Tax=Alicycliphilus denitrificans TaxID=179636 RepID=UPI002155DECA|nr:hypothetical protein [Alicycliphilus denitrificans]